MNSDCEKMKDQIADLLTGNLSDLQMQKLQQHLNECTTCRDYARELKNEDVLLTEFFAGTDMDTASRQERLLQAIDRVGPSGQTDALSIRRTIMKSPITKLAAAAAIIIAVSLSIHFWNKSTPSAYAFEQTVEAMKGKRAFHIQTYWGSPDWRKDEYWAQFDEEGKLLRSRQAEWNGQEEEDGPCQVTIWEDNIRNRYYPENGIQLITGIGKTEGELEEFDPGFAVQKVYEQVASSEAILTFDIQELSADEKLIIITVTNTNGDFRRILFVDPDTDFVVRVDRYELTDEQQWAYLDGIEVLEYNQPFDPNVFSLDIPENTITLDQVSQEVGMAQDDMSDEEAASQIVRRALEAWAAEDYDQASNLFGGAPAELLTEHYPNLRPISIISIGQPVPVEYRKSWFMVPCKYEVVRYKENARFGQIIEIIEPTLHALAVDGQPGRWYVSIERNP
jgi:hypothetical protein